MKEYQNPIQKLYRDLLFWKTFALLTVPTLFLLLLAMTHYAYLCQSHHAKPKPTLTTVVQQPGSFQR